MQKTKVIYGLNCLKEFQSYFRIDISQASWNVTGDKIISFTLILNISVQDFR